MMSNEKESKAKCPLLWFADIGLHSEPCELSKSKSTFLCGHSAAG